MSKSPFPGMDPYLEGFWGDVHAALTMYARDQLNAQLPPGLVARVEEYLALESEISDASHGYYPDVQIAEEPEAGGGVAVASETATVTEPYVIPISLEPPTLRAIRIYDPQSGNRVITAIEFLSPSNKSGDADTRAYRRKQRDFLDAGINVVEIDLLREGHYVLVPPKLALPFDCREPYRICVVRARRRGEVYRASFKEKLPTIRIPLRNSDADVVLNVQNLVDHCYESGRYFGSIDYRQPARPPLRDDDAVWCDQFLREKKLR